MIAEGHRVESRRRSPTEHRPGAYPASRPAIQAAVHTTRRRRAEDTDLAPDPGALLRPAAQARARPDGHPEPDRGRPPWCTGPAVRAWTKLATAETDPRRAGPGHHRVGRRARRGTCLDMAGEPRSPPAIHYRAPRPPAGRLSVPGNSANLGFEGSRQLVVPSREGWENAGGFGSTGHRGGNSAGSRAVEGRWALGSA